MQGAYPASPAALATNIFSTIYPQNEKYHNIQRPTDNFSNKFFGSEALSTRFAEPFSENYQQTEGINFPNYETHKSEGYQDLSGTTVECDYSEVKKRKKKKRQGK
ncbi:unnamed protein product [Parnassius mnemosyne]|uniref:Uncharacterized protein n=1 Tax=Parnassius mnemosyne TaxID=213953 RepID=A0AAV1LHG6_9NEOP